MFLITDVHRLVLDQIIDIQVEDLGVQITPTEGVTIIVEVDHDSTGVL